MPVATWCRSHLDLVEPPHRPAQRPRFQSTERANGELSSRPECLRRPGWSQSPNCGGRVGHGVKVPGKLCTAKVFAEYDSRGAHHVQRVDRRSRGPRRGRDMRPARHVPPLRSCHSALLAVDVVGSCTRLGDMGVETEVDASALFSQAVCESWEQVCPVGPFS